MPINCDVQFPNLLEFYYYLLEHHDGSSTAVIIYYFYAPCAAQVSFHIFKYYRL